MKLTRLKRIVNTYCGGMENKSGARADTNASVWPGCNGHSRTSSRSQRMRHQVQAMPSWVALARHSVTAQVFLPVNRIRCAPTLFWLELFEPRSREVVR